MSLASSNLSLSNAITFAFPSKTSFFSFSNLYGTNNVILANGKTKPVVGNPIYLGDFKGATTGQPMSDLTTVLATASARYEINNASSFSGIGTVINDVSGNGNNLTIYNSPTYNSSPPSIAFTFSNQRAVSADGRNFLTNVNTFSIEVVVNPSAQSTTNRWICQWNSSLVSNGQGIGVRINNGVPTLTNMMNGTQFNTGTTINTNQWYHIVAAINLQTGSSYFYVNNSKITPVGNFTMSNFTTTGRYYSIGDMQDSIRQSLLGSFGIVRWYPVTLTDADVNALYSSSIKTVYGYA